MGNLASPSMRILGVLSGRSVVTVYVQVFSVIAFVDRFMDKFLLHAYVSILQM